MGFIFILGVIGTFLLIARLVAGDWMSVFKGVVYILAFFLIGAVAVGVLLGIIALWAFISMALTGNLP
ncbi:membrane protein [Microbacterium phage Zooman]|nr:membrane protein [Microbacterium phage Zooman]